MSTFESLKKQIEAAFLWLKMPGPTANFRANAMALAVRHVVYAARVALKERRILVGGRWIPLGPGMTVTAEIKTGERRVIEYFLSPFIRYTDEALRER